MHEKTKGMDEDWLALFLGLIIFALSLFSLGGMDVLGWAVKTSEWMEPGKAMSTVSKSYAPASGEIVKIGDTKITIKKSDGKETDVSLPGEQISALKVGDHYEKSGIPGIVSLFLTYAAMLGFMLIGAKLMGANLTKFAIGFTVIFWISYVCWFLGHYAYIAATKDKLDSFKIPWSLSLTGESGYILALAAGLALGNFFPNFSEKLKEAAKPELYIKTAIVIMGAALGLKAANSFTLASNIMFRGLCAIIEAYLIYWAFVYFIARKYFKFSKEWAAPLASGISICGVSASIATGGAIRARPIVPIMVSSLVVIFAVVEMVILPFAAQAFLWNEPLVAGAWMGLAVKTDGGAVASGAITDALIRGRALDEGIRYQEGWITMTSTTVKMFIDIFIGVWAFVLAIIWSAKIEKKEGDRVRMIEIWHRFPKFVLGYVFTFFVVIVMAWPASTRLGAVDNTTSSLKQENIVLQKKLETAQGEEVMPLRMKLTENNEKIKTAEDSVKGDKTFISTAKSMTDSGNIFRVLFFVFTFFTIGLVSNFKKLMEEGIGKLMVVYVVALFGFIIWVGLFISWLFFHGVKPPTM